MPGHVPGIFFGGIACGVIFFTDVPERAGYSAAIKVAVCIPPENRHENHQQSPPDY